MKAAEGRRRDKLEKPASTLKEKIGVTIRELLDLPQGAIAFAVVSQRRPEEPRRRC